MNEGGGGVNSTSKLLGPNLPHAYVYFRPFVGHSICRSLSNTPPPAYLTVLAQKVYPTLEFIPDIERSTSLSTNVD